MHLVRRLRTLFDIYSPRPESRLAVLACMALGAWLLARGLATGTGIGAIPFVVLVWANHERFLATVEGVFERKGWLVLAIPILVFAARLAQFPPTASDDLLRHIASAFWPQGYRDMYVETSLPPAGLYPAFDWMVGTLARSVGLAPAMWIVQALACISFVLVFALAAGRLLSRHPMAPVMTLAGLVLVLQVMAGRLFLGRPEVFMMVWALSALLVRGQGGALVWLASGVALSAGYWLAPIYYPAVLLLGQSTRRRAMLFVALAVGWLLMWWHFTDGRLVEAMRWTLEQVDNRLPGLGVQENLGIVGALLMPQMLLLAFGSLWASRRQGADNRLLLLAGYFMLSNQVRYGGIMAPLFALHLLSGVASAQPRWPALTRGIAVALGSVSMSVIAAGIPPLADLPRFALPHGAVVLTGFSEASYSTLFANPGTVRVAPAFEVGAAHPAVQRLVLQLSVGKLDCASLAGTVFTHLIEDGLRGESPPCLSLVAVQGRWRSWRIGNE